jgi:hypothetical protein
LVSRGGGVALRIPVLKPLPPPPPPPAPQPSHPAPHHACVLRPPAELLRRSAGLLATMTASLAFSVAHGAAMALLTLSPTSNRDDTR